MGITFLMNIFEALCPTWVELSFIPFFLLGCAFWRFDTLLRLSKIRKPIKKAKKAPDSVLIGRQAVLHKSLEADLRKGHATSTLNVWRAGQARMPTPDETLQVVTQAFLEADLNNLVQEILQHLQTHKDEMCLTRTVAAVLDTLAHSGHVVILEEFANVVQKQPGWQVHPSSKTCEILLAGYAAAGDELRVRTAFAEARAEQVRISPRAYALTIKGFLKNGMLDASLQQILDMQMAGFFVPSFALTQFFRAACEAGRVAEIFDRVWPSVKVPSDALVPLMEDALKRNDLAFASRVEKLAREGNVPLPAGAYCSFLKLCVVNADLHALQLFQEMQNAGLRISDGLCVSLLARCADSKFLRFAEVVVRYLRARDGLTIEVFSCLMKCYAYCGMYDKACDLYDEIQTAGLEPDSMMYGCLMKFAVECGRTELSQQLAERAPSLDIKNYMSLIRAAGRDKDVARALALLQRLETMGMTADIAAYSCVLDACVAAGDMFQARALIDQMKQRFGSLDVITFNILLKGYCSLGDIKMAKEIIEEMKSLGFPPNDVSFNCLINAVVSKGDFAEAWRTIDIMEKSGVPVDHYTLSIIMKSVKRGKDTNVVNQAFDLLDRVGVDVCSDEVLLNTVLETCIRHSQFHRLDTIIRSFAASSLQPSVNTYGSLIKACSSLKRVDRCWELWNFMSGHRGIVPNDIVLGCMLDALVCNKRVDDAVLLFQKWKQIVPPNTVMYSTIIKGFANSRQAARAMEMWQEMRELRLPMNSVVYHSLIDAQARVGAMDRVSDLVEDMVSNGLELDKIFYSTIIKGYCVKGDLDKAFEVFRGMQASSSAVDCIVYNTILDGCTKQNRMDLADEVIDDMEKYAVKPSTFTLGILVKMHGRRGELDKAFEIVDLHAQRHGIRPNLQVRTCLMCACLYNHDIDRAFKVFEDLKAIGQGADAKAYSALVSGIARNCRARLPEAVELVKEAYGLGQKGIYTHEVPPPGMEIEAVEKLLSVLESQGMMDNFGWPLMEQLRAAQVPVCGRFLSSVL